MKQDTKRALRRSGQVQRRVLLAYFIMVCLVATWIVLLGREVPENDAARLVAVGDLKTNGEHWIIFRLDAPPKRAVQIATVQIIGNDNIPVIVYPLIRIGCGSILSLPDSTVPISKLIKAGSSKQFRVRHAGGGEWRVRLCLMVRLGFRRQCAARIEGCWRLKSFKPWTRDYVERNYSIVESEAVRTIDSRITNPPTSPSPITPWSPTDDIFSLQ